MEDLYHLLGISRRATTAEIRRAFRRRSKEVHPDVNGSSALAEEQFKRLNEAFQTLSDPARRRQYDQAATTGTAKNTQATSASAHSRPYQSARAATYESRKPGRVWSPYFILYGILIVWIGLLGHEIFREEQPRRSSSAPALGLEHQRFLELYQHYPDLISTGEAEAITGKRHLPNGFTTLLESLLQRGDTTLFRKLILLQTDPEQYRNRYYDEKDQRPAPAGDKRY